MLVSKLRSIHALAGLALGLALLPAHAAQKGGMADLCQEEETCLPTSTANLMIWFGKHGYPKLIKSGATDDERNLHTVHAIIESTNARYDLGTRTDGITSGIEKYIRSAGYSCDVEYRGLDWSQVKFPEIVKDPEGDRYKLFYKKPAAFSQDWLQENSDPNKGFILLLAYITYDRSTNSFSDAINAGHAVTLVSAEPTTVLIDDPAHWSDEPGLKILTPEVLTGGVFHLPGYDAPVDGLLLLSGSLLEAPPGAGVLLTGAVEVTMHPDSQGGSSVIASAGGAPTSTVGGGKDLTSPSKTGPTPTTPSTPESSWAMWIFDLVFKK
ncbi:MAG: hypothetical protein WDO13_04705 [Verrucomicrobiota bacterium]